MNTSPSRRHWLSRSVLGACALSLGLMGAPAIAQNNAKVLSIGMPFSPLSMTPRSVATAAPACTCRPLMSL